MSARLLDRLRHWRPASPITLFAVLVPTFANAAWVILERRNQPLDIDEAGYISMSLNDYLGLRTGGLSGWWHQIDGQTLQAPLAPALASLLHWLTDPRVLNAYAVSVAAYALALAATAALTRHWPRLERASALLFVAASPVLLDFSRGFLFAELASAMLAGALYFAHRSLAFRRTGPALAWGACLGLMLLSRTMTVAFLPGLVLAALVPVLARGSPSGGLRIVAGLGVGAGLAATWYAHNFGPVYNYLTSTGYGAQAAQYGPARSVFSLHSWYEFLISTTDGYLYAGVALFVAIGWVSIAGIGVHRAVLARRAGLRLRSQLCVLRAWAARDPLALACAIVTAAGMAALVSSRNQGSGFVAPLVVPMMIVASRGASIVLRSATRGRRLSLAAIASVSLSCLAVGITLLAAALTFLPTATETGATIGFFGGHDLQLWKSAGTLRNYEDAGRVPPSVEPDPGSQTVGRAWVAASKYTEDEIWAASTARERPPVVVFTFFNLMLNTNTVDLESLLWRRAGIGLAQINPLSGQSRIADYLAQVAPINSAVTVVATTNASTVDEVQPSVPHSVGLAYVHLLGFEQVARRRLPDGTWLTLWAPPA